MITTKEKFDAASEIQRRLGIEVVDIYEELAETIWNKVVPTLGEVTMTAMAERAIFKTGRRFEIVRDISTTRQGLDFAAVRQRFNGRGNSHEVGPAFRDLISNLLEILATMTGRAVKNRLLADVDSLTA